MSRTGDLVHGLAVSCGWTRYRRHRGIGAPVFCFHNVVSAESVSGDPSLHVPIRSFCAYLDWIETVYTIVPLSEIAERLGRGASVASLAALTFDDAYCGFLQHAVPVLRARAHPATVFLVTAAADAPAPFWWDQLATHGVLTDARREEYLKTLRGDTAAILRTHSDTAESVGNPDLLPASWAQMKKGLYPGLHIGSHTVTHRNLAVLSPSEISAEVAGSRDIIAEQFDTPIDLLSYPYGLFTAAVTESAEAAGYRAAVGLRRGLAHTADSLLALPRVNVPAGISLNALECRAAGLALGR